MAEASIVVAVRVRPFSEREAAQLAPQHGALPFLGDGGLGGSPAKQVAPIAGLRTRFLRPIVHTVDEKVLIFDPPDNNPLSRLYNNTQTNYMAHGQKRAKDVRYAFDRVFNEKSSQRDVFQGTTDSLLDGVLNGFNATVFAYGATGCGKTHTISGSPEDPGLIFLTMKELYQRIADSQSESEVQLRLSYLEIYNEMIRDLLSETPTPPGQGLPLREDEASKMSVVGISEHTPASPDDVLSMIQEGNQRRTMSPTEANAVSSRSHAVLQINVTQRPKTGDVRDATTSASLNIIDLAGSERASATSNNGARMKEGANINKSLLALGNCINALCSTGVKSQHIPYRNSKLTRLLKFSLGGNCKTVMIVCVSPSSGHYEETHNTLKYANQAKNIRTKVSQNVVNVDRHVASYVRTIHELKEEVAQLKAQLAEGGPVDSESDKRKKQAAKTEMESVLSDLRIKVHAAKMSIHHESHHEAAVQTAEHSFGLYRQRLEELNGLLREWRRGRDLSVDEEEPLDWTSERSFLQSLLRKDEVLLQASREGARNLSSGIDLLMGLLNRAPRNSRFDSDSAERVKLIADSLKTEVEAEREKARATAALQSFQLQAKRCLGWLEVASRSTAILKDVAGQLEWRADHGHDREELVAHLKSLVASARNDIKQNDAKFKAETGKETQMRASAYGNRLAPRSATSTLRRPRASLLSGSMPANGTAADLTSNQSRLMATAAKPAALHSRRSSFSQGIHRPTAASLRRARPSIVATQSGRMAPFSPGRSPARLRAGRPSLAGPTGRPAPPFANMAKVAFTGAQRPFEGQSDNGRAKQQDMSESGTTVKGVRFQEAKEHDGKAAITKPTFAELSPTLDPTILSVSSSSDLSTEWEDVKGRDNGDLTARGAITKSAAAVATKAAPTAVKSAGRRSFFGNNSIVPQAPAQRPAVTLTALNEDDGALGEEEEDEDEDEQVATRRLRLGRSSGNFNAGSSANEDTSNGKSTKRLGFSAPTAASRARRVGASETGGVHSIFADENVALLPPPMTTTLHRARDQGAPYRLRDSEVGPARRGRGSIGSSIGGSKVNHISDDFISSTGGVSGLMASVRGPSMPPPRTSMFPSVASAASAGSGNGSGTSMFASGKVSTLVLPSNGSSSGGGGSIIRSGRISDGSVVSIGSSTGSSTVANNKLFGVPTRTASRNRLSHAPTSSLSDSGTGGGGGGTMANPFGSIGRSTRIPPILLPPSAAR